MNQQNQIYVIALNVVAALFVVSLATEFTISIFLAHFAPLFVIFSGLVFPWIYTALAVLVIGFMYSIVVPTIGIYYFIMVAIPSVAICYFSALNEQYTIKLKNTDNTLISKTINVIHWFPIGTILLIIAIYCALVGCIFTYNFAGNLDGFVEALAPIIQKIKSMPDLPVEIMKLIESEKSQRIVILVLPIGATCVWYMSLIAMYYGAARLASSMNIFNRRWPDLAYEFMMPTSAAIASAIALLLSFTDEPLGYFAEFFTATLLILWAASGLSVVHFFARQTPFSHFILGIFYAGLIFMGWLLVAIALLGVFDALFQWREKYRAKFTTTP